MKNRIRKSDVREIYYLFLLTILTKGVESRFPATCLYITSFKIKKIKYRLDLILAAESNQLFDKSIFFIIQ